MRTFPGWSFGLHFNFAFAEKLTQSRINIFLILNPHADQAN